MSTRHPGATSGRMCADSATIAHFKASRETADYYGLSDDHRFVEVRYERASSPTDGDERPIDEIVTPGIHLESMNVDAVWMNVKGVHVWLRAIRVKGDRRPRLIVTCFPDDATPVVVEQGAMPGHEDTPGPSPRSLEAPRASESPKNDSVGTMASERACGAVLGPIERQRAAG